MISLTDKLTDEEIDFLKKSWRGKRIYSYYKAYGTSYSFCKFYRAKYENANGIILIINASMEGEFQGDFSVDELSVFIMQNIPFRVQLTEYVTENLIAYMNENEHFKASYTTLRRTCFELASDGISDKFSEDDVDFNPKLDDVYKILEKGFPNILEYGLWLTDTSHRVRHGVSHCFLYKNATTATVLFDVNNDIVVGQVATLPEARGMGYARDFLKWLASFLEMNGKHAVLYALDVRRSFYKEIGFKEIGTEYVLEYKKMEKDELTKGKLV